MRMITIASALALTLASGTAFAQSAPASSAPTALEVAEMVIALAPGGMLLGDTPSTSVRYVSVQPADMVTSGLIGATIYNTKDEKIGEVADLVVSGGNEVTGVVASVGGFLGIGQSYVVIDPATVVVYQKNGSWAAAVNTTREDLASAPKYQYPSKSG